MGFTRRWLLACAGMLFLAACSDSIHVKPIAAMPQRTAFTDAAVCSGMTGGTWGPQDLAADRRFGLVYIAGASQACGDGTPRLVVVRIDVDGSTRRIAGAWEGIACDAVAGCPRITLAVDPQRATLFVLVAGATSSTLFMMDGVTGGITNITVPATAASQAVIDLDGKMVFLGYRSGSATLELLRVDSHGNVLSFPAPAEPASGIAMDGSGTLSFRPGSAAFATDGNVYSLQGSATQCVLVRGGATVMDPAPACGSLSANGLGLFFAGPANWQVFATKP